MTKLKRSNLRKCKLERFDLRNKNEGERKKGSSLVKMPKKEDLILAKNEFESKKRESVKKV